MWSISRSLKLFSNWVLKRIYPEVRGVGKMQRSSEVYGLPKVYTGWPHLHPAPLSSFSLLFNQTMNLSMLMLLRALLCLAAVVLSSPLALDGESDSSSQEAWCPHWAYMHSLLNSIWFKCIYIYLAPMCQLKIFWKEPFLSIVIFSWYITVSGNGSSTLLYMFEECIGPWSHRLTHCTRDCYTHGGKEEDLLPWE